MISFALLVPIVAAGSLTAAFLMPIRDERRGERATLRGFEPLRPLFAPQDPVESTRRAKLVDRTRSALGRWFGASPASPANVVPDETPIDLETVPATTFEEHVTGCLFRDADTADERPEALGEATPSGGETTHDVVHDAPDPSIPQPRSSSGRDAVPPLTRTRLRPVRPGITWPARLRVAHVNLNDAERRELLIALGRTCCDDDEDALRTAFNEEDGAGRLLALRALAHVETEPVRRLFRETAIRGSEEERSFSVDILARYGEREALFGVLGDRIDAIAASAALAIVASHRRVDYESELAGHVDATRLELLLALLAAVVQ